MSHTKIERSVNRLIRVCPQNDIIVKNRGGMGYFCYCVAAVISQLEFTRTCHCKSSKAIVKCVCSCCSCKNVLTGNYFNSLLLVRIKVDICIVKCYRCNLFCTAKSCCPITGSYCIGCFSGIYVFNCFTSVCIVICNLVCRHNYQIIIVIHKCSEMSCVCCYFSNCVCARCICIIT